MESVKLSYFVLSSTHKTKYSNMKKKDLEFLIKKAMLEASIETHRGIAEKMDEKLQEARAELEALKLNENKEK